MLWKKMLRDVLHQKSQFFSIFFMCFLGMFIYSGIDGEWRGMKQESERLYEQAQLADAIVYGETPALVELDFIKQRETRLMVYAKDITKDEHDLHVYALQEGELSSMVITEGEAYSPTKDGIWLDAEYAKANGLSLNDALTLQIGEHTLTKTIIGLGYHPDYIYALKDESSMLPDHLTFGFAFISKLQEPLLNNVPDNMTYLTSDLQEEALKLELQKHTAAQLLVKSEFPGVSVMQSEIEQHRSIGGIFPVIFFLIAMLTTLNTMRKMILNQRIQLGTLKALGFHKRKLYLHYASHILVVSALGCGLGTICGPLIVPALIFTMQKEMYALPNWYGLVDSSVWLLCGCSIVLCVKICICSIHLEMRETAAACMRPKEIKVYGTTHTLSQRTNQKHFYLRWNLRDLKRNKARALMAVVGIFGCSALLCASLGLMDSIQSMLEDEYQVLQTYETKIIVSQALSEQQLKEWKQEFHASAIQEATGIMKCDEEQTSIPMLILEDTRYRKLDALKPDQELPVDGVSISRKLAAEYDLSASDSIKLRLSGSSTWIDVKIKSIHQAPLGQGIIMSDQAYTKLTKQTMKPTALLSGMNDIVLQAGMDKLLHQEDLAKDTDTMMEAMLVLIGVLILAAFLLGTVVLYNFTSLSYYERFRDMATLKVLGFKKQPIRQLMISQNVCLCTIGVVLGIPFGYVMVSFMASTLSQDMDLLVRIQPSSLLIAVGFTYGMVWLITYWYCRTIDHIDMVSALKSPE